jgi:hypothetical protein
MLGVTWHRYQERNCNRLFVDAGLYYDFRVASGRPIIACKAGPALRERLVAEGYAVLPRLAPDVGLGAVAAYR